MANTYVILNNDYAVDDYAQANYVGTASDLYAQDGYILDAILGTAFLDCTAETAVLGGVIKQSSSITMDGVLNATIQINAIVSPSVDISAQFSLSTDANVTRLGTANLITAGDEVTWETALTWYEPRSDVWGPLFSADASVNKIASASLSTNFNLTVEGVITAIADITAQGFASVSASARADFTGGAQLDTAATLVTAAIKGADVVDFRMNSAFALSSDGFVVVLSQPFTISSQYAVSTQANITASGVLNAQSDFAVDLPGNQFRIRFGETDIASNFSVDVSAQPTLSGTSVLASQISLDSSANPRYGAFQDVLSSQFSTRTNGGRLRFLSGTLQGFTSTLGVLTIYNIDPYRVYPIQSEQRFTKIVPDSRVFMLLDENRVNTIVGEPRHFTIPSETRQITVQPNPLVELDTILDRRQG